MWLEQTKCGGDEARETWGLAPVGPCRSWPGQVFFLRAGMPLHDSGHMSSDPELSMEASSLEGQACLQTAPEYTFVIIFMF